ncbi:hypothetical protein [Trinickia symbiotica]|uniref:Uncharacterized protein n=1 Tax=Trinickia symbiotica TaxID=863227 RepID=A0A2N7X231_9BURK|nr:hypothetical protein [Trinickia symbiotica]PMS35535.1 hypothetical protein C0Z20_16605 [Trinickia symbiotica]
MASRTIKNCRPADHCKVTAGFSLFCSKREPRRVLVRRYQQVATRASAAEYRKSDAKFVQWHLADRLARGDDASGNPACRGIELPAIGYCSATDCDAPI